MNKIIKHTLETRLEELKKIWADELPDVMWSYRITHRTSTSEKPFALAYGAEAMIPIELSPKHRVLNFREQPNEEAMAAELNFLDEKRLDADAKNTMYRQ